ncbi:hypothetical protein RAS1_18740 [Phycisphaerae bacterium RAS1]|nr:hypothetical protein RAS1_18740 [Phycisphaerae bacterium RAS1]
MEFKFSLPGWKCEPKRRCFGWSGVAIADGNNSRIPNWLSPLDFCFDRLFEYYDRYMRATDDVPWWYGERTCLSDLAAAASVAGMLVSTEYPIENKSRHAGRRRDLWLLSPDRAELEVESKQCYLNPATSWEKYPNQRLDAAARQFCVGDQRLGTRLALCFVRAKYSTRYAPGLKPDKIPDATNDWFGEDAEPPPAKRVNAFWFYWADLTDANTAKRICITSENWHCPGVFALVRQVNRAHALPRR